MVVVGKRSWKSIQNKRERFSGAEFMEAMEFMKRVKARYSQLELTAMGFKRYSVAGWYNSGVIPRDETLAKLKEIMANDTPRL